VPYKIGTINGGKISFSIKTPLKDASMKFPLAFIFTSDELSDVYVEPDNYTLLYYSHTEYVLYYSTIINKKI